jgi:hypothetical protein
MYLSNTEEESPDWENEDDEEDPEAEFDDEEALDEDF